MTNITRTLVVALTTAYLGASGMAQTQSGGKPDMGKREYESKCMVCHGPVGKGNGSYGELLKKPASDLTMLKRNNGGVFPFDWISAVIDGRQYVKEHGARDMPIWGREYSADKVAAGAYYVDVPYDQEMFVRVRILALVDYLDRLQTK